MRAYVTACHDTPQLLPLLPAKQTQSADGPLSGSLGLPRSYFHLSTVAGVRSQISLPPIARWPARWSFATWLRIEPMQASTGSTPVAPTAYLFYLRSTRDLLGYSAHMAGRCLVVTSMKVKGKGDQHCVPFEFQPFRWYHLVLTYHTSSWFSLTSNNDKSLSSSSAGDRMQHDGGSGADTHSSSSGGASSIACYVDGVLVDRTDMNWTVGEFIVGV